MKKFLIILYVALIFGLNHIQASYIVTTQSGLAGSEIAINEIHANPTGTDTGNEWIELYNLSDTTFNLLNWKLQDLSLKEFVFEAVEIEPNSFVVVYPSFSLNQSDEEVQLYDNFGNIVDTFSYSNSSEGLSWSRVPDGLGSWVADSNPTPGETNNTEIIAYPSEVFISEIFPTPSENPQEWVEIFNNSNEAIDLANWSLSDTSNSVTITNLIAEPFSYALIFEENLASVTLNNTEDTITLRDPNGKVVDEFIYGETEADISNILYESTTIQTQALTPGEANVYIDPFDCYFKSTSTDIQAFKNTPLSDEINYNLVGFVSAEKGSIYDNRIYVQDDHGGLMISLPTDFSLELAIGDEIALCGEHSQYYNEDELIITKQDSVHKTGTNKLPEIFETQPMEQTLVGRLVSVNGEIIENSSTSMTIQTSLQQIKIKLSHLDLKQEKSKGDIANIVGVLTRYGETEDNLPNYRIVPRSEGDIKILPKQIETTPPSTKEHTTKNMTPKSTLASSTKAKSQFVKGLSDNSIAKIELSTPAFQNKQNPETAFQIEGIERVEKPNSNIEKGIRAVGASGFVISNSTIFLLFRKKHPL